MRNSINAIILFKEITDLKRKKNREGEIPFNNILNWYFFTIGMIYMSIRTFEDKIIAGNLDESSFIGQVLFKKRDLTFF